MTTTAVASAVDATGAAIAVDDTTAATLIHDLPALVAGDLVFAVAPPTDRTTIEIVVERDASLVLKAPHGVTVERATQFVDAPSAAGCTASSPRKTHSPAPQSSSSSSKAKGSPTSAAATDSPSPPSTTGARLGPGSPPPTRPARLGAHRGPARSPPRTRPLPHERRRRRPGRRSDAQLVHQRRRPMAATQNPPLGSPPR